MPFAATWKDLEIIILREVRKIRKISYGITNTTYMWNLKMIQMNLFTKQKQTHRHRSKFMVIKEDSGVVGGRDKLGVLD